MDTSVQNLKNIVLTGDEENVRRFITEHWNELPQKIQDAAFAGMFVDVLRENTRQNEEFAAFKRDLVGLLEAVASGADA